jgi:pimeloyl-ACP methyl ester carboxylesterase
VVIQHGVTVDRRVMLAMADAFASQGFGVVAIDLPLHGVTDINSPFYAPLGTTERHFNADNVGPLGDYNPDGQIDDGWQIFNLENPMNMRDHGRQTVADLIQLLRTLPTMDFDGDQVPDVDPNRLHFVNLSLGGMFSMALLAVNDEFSTVTSSSPGGRFIDFGYDPMAIVFGLPLREAVEARGLAFGTLAFDDFARDLQTVLDPIEPLNYAAAGAALHPIHVVEVLSDTTVPATLTENVARLMNLTTVSAPGTANPTGVRGIVRFTAGAHSSMFSPVPSLAVTTEMQTEAVAFALSAGTQLPVANAAVVQ